MTMRIDDSNLTTNSIQNNQKGNKSVAIETVFENILLEIMDNSTTLEPNRMSNLSSLAANLGSLDTNINDNNDAFQNSRFYLDLARLFWENSAGSIDGLVQKNHSIAGISAVNPYSNIASSAHGKVEMADWWTVVDGAFARGQNATVTDVRTGISFQVHRMGGTNHADVEPLTAEDTAKMKAAYGGTWSWDRRAVWVDVGGRRFAGSMNGMPHGQDTIANNNMEGQTCIHFLNSRTHNTNSIDARHQEEVRYAYDAG